MKRTRYEAEEKSANQEPEAFALDEVREFFEYCSLSAGIPSRQNADGGSDCPCCERDAALSTLQHWMYP